MTIAQQLKSIRDAASMQSWIPTVSASLVIANDRSLIRSYLSNKPGSCNVVILFDGEEKRGEHEEAGRVDRTFKVIVTRAQNMTMTQDDFVADDNSLGLSSSDLFEGCRDAVRGVRFDADVTEVYPNYKGMRPYDMGEALIDAQEIEFSIGTQLDAII